MILLQSRKFSMGDTTILAELSTMHTNLSSKQCLIIHTEDPIELMVNTQRKLTKDLDSGTEQIPKNKKEDIHRGIPTQTPDIHLLREISRHPLK